VRIRFRVATLTVAAMSGLVAVAGCGSSSSGNGVSSKSPDAIVTASTDAIHGVKSVHVSGATVTEGSPTKFDLTLVSGKGGHGEMSQNGLSFQIVSLGGNVYINGSDTFWRHFGGQAAVQLFHGKWLKAPASGQLASISSLTNLQELFGKLLTEHGTLAKGAITTVNGHKVIAVNDTTKGGTLYVATTGKPYPIEVQKKGSEGGRIAFDHYNEPVSLSAPANAVDLSQLH
jgi:hypothetical protein